MKQKTLIVFAGLLLLGALLPVIVMSQNNQRLSLEEPELAKDKEFKQILKLLPMAQEANALVVQSGISPYITALLTYLNGENPKQFAAEIKLKTEILDRFLAGHTPGRIGAPGALMNDSVRTATNTIAWYNKGLFPPEIPPTSIVMKGEKIALLQKVQTEFLYLDTNILIIKTMLQEQILPKLEKINEGNPDTDLTSAIENVKNAITGAQEIRDELVNNLNRVLSAYINRLNSIPEQPISQLEGDLNGDGSVNIFDLVIVARNFGKKLA